MDMTFIDIPYINIIERSIRITDLILYLISLQLYLCKCIDVRLCVYERATTYIYNEFM